MDFNDLKKISQDSYDTNLQKNNALKKAQSDQIVVYNNHIFKADAHTICMAKLLRDLHGKFFILDTNNNPVRVDDPDNFLDVLVQKNQSSLNTYHQLYQKLKNKSS